MSPTRPPLIVSAPSCHRDHVSRAKNSMPDTLASRGLGRQGGSRPNFRLASSLATAAALASSLVTCLSLSTPTYAVDDSKSVPPFGAKDDRRGIPRGGHQGKDHLYCCHPGAHGTLEGRMIEVEMPEPPPPLDIAWEFETIRWFGPSDNRIDMVFVGDGYQANDLTAYRNHAEGAWQFLEAREPYATYRRYFNVHRVDVISADEGVDNDPTPGISRNTALDMAFWANNIERLLSVNTAKAQQAAESAPDWDQILAVANSAKYGGAGYGGADVGTFAGANSSSFAVAEHELGHSFGDLADEYDYDADPPHYAGPELVERNVSIRDRATMVADNAKWVDWLGVTLPGVGVHDCFQGGYYHQTGVFRPTSDSLMRNLNRPYNGPSIEQMIVKIHLATKMADSFTHSVGSAFSAGGTVGATLVEPIGYSLEKRWKLGGVLIPGAQGAFLETGELSIPPGGTSLTLEVTDPNPLVRNNFFKLFVMREVYTWTLLPQNGLTCGSALTVQSSIPSTAAFDTRIDTTPSNETPCGIEDQWAVWRRVVATCDGMMTVSACPTVYASGKVTLAMAEECGAFAACSTDNSATCGSPDGSSIRFGVLQGEDYYIRISATGQGDVAGTLTMSCTPINSLASCFSEHEGIGCSSTSCTARVCTADPFCCDQSWDNLCVLRADAICQTGYDCDEAKLLWSSEPSSYEFNTGWEGWYYGFPTPCGSSDTRAAWRRYIAPSSGIMSVEICTEFAEAQMTLALYENCSEPLNAIACSATAGADCPLGGSVRLDYPVLAGRSYLIRISAKNSRYAAGTLSVTTSAVCGQGGACDEVHFSPGCSDAECCVSVCTADPYCCTNSWDNYCVQGTARLCGGTPGDINSDGAVDAADLSLLLSLWGTTGGPADIDGDGTVGASDLALLLASWTS
jgi:hypothetical protein